MSLQNENIKQESCCSFSSILHRVRSNLEEYVRDNKSADERFGKFCDECSEPKGFVFFFSKEKSENSECEGIGFFIVRHNNAWSFPICVEISNLDKIKSKTNSPLYIIKFQDQHVVDTFIHQEGIDLAKDIHKDMDSDCSKQFCMYSLSPNKMDSVDMNNLIIKNCQKMNQECYGSRFVFAVILRGKLEKNCTEDYDALIKFINEKCMPKGLSSQDESETKSSIGNKLNEFKQTAGTQLNMAKEQLGNAMHNVKNKAGELVSNVQSILINDAETVTVNPTKEEKDISSGAKSSTLEAGKEKIKETISNIKDKASGKAQDLKCNIENKFSKSHANDKSLQNESASENNSKLSSQSEDIKSKNKDSAISNVPLYRNAENKNEMENLDDNSRKEIREKQSLSMQEKPEDEKKTFGSKLHDLKGMAEHQLTAAKEQIGSELNIVKTKAEGLVSNLHTSTTVSDDHEKEQKEKPKEQPKEQKDKAAESIGQESKGLQSKNSEKKRKYCKTST